jgi:Protein of unknown function (DUF2806)
MAAEITGSQIRDLFARIIAGEINRPGSFTLKTLETVRLLDQKVATLFQKMRHLAIDGDVVVSESETLLDAEGIGLDESLELQDAGLVDIDSIGLVVEAKASVQWNYGDYRSRVENHGEDRAWIDVLRFTRVGRELASVLPFEPSATYFRALCAMLATTQKGKFVVRWRKKERGSGWFPRL